MINTKQEKIANDNTKLIWYYYPFLKEHYCPEWARSIVSNRNQSCHLVCYPLGLDSKQEAWLSPTWEQGMWHLRFNWAHLSDEFYSKEIPYKDAELSLNIALENLKQELEQALQILTGKKDE